MSNLERDNLIDGFFNKGYACDLNDVYQSVMGTIKDLEKANDEKVEKIERLNNIIKEIRKMLYKKTLDEYDTYTANIVCDFQSDFEEIIRLNGGDEE
jgi:type I site-specific restriction endonuclease